MSSVRNMQASRPPITIRMFSSADGLRPDYPEGRDPIRDYPRER